MREFVKKKKTDQQHSELSHKVKTNNVVYGF